MSRTHFARFLIEAGYAQDVQGRLQALSHARQARLRRARVGDAVAGGRLDPRAPAARPCIAHPGPLQRHAHGHARSCSPNSATRGGDAHRNPVAVAHAGAVRRSSRRMRACLGLAAPAARDCHGPGESWMDLGDLPRLAGGRRARVEGLVGLGECRRAGPTITRMPIRRTVFFISDRTGITAEMLGNSLLSQFEDIEFARRDDPVRRFAGEGRRRSIAPGQRDRRARGPAGRSCSAPIVDEAMSETIRRDANALTLDLFQMFIAPLEAELGAKSSHAAGRSHGIANSHEYFARMEAINFTQAHDDGAATRELGRGAGDPGRRVALRQDADVALSRAAVRHPRGELSADARRFRRPQAAGARCCRTRDRLFGLTIQPERLHEIREERRPGSQYAALDNCRYEVREAEHLMQREGIPMLDTTSKSIEEIATTILHRAKLRTPHLLSGDAMTCITIADPLIHAVRGLWCATLTPVGRDGARRPRTLRAPCAAACSRKASTASRRSARPAKASRSRWPSARTGFEALLAAALRRERVVAATGCAALTETIALTRARARNRAAPRCLVLPPFFFKNVSDDGLYALYATLDRSASPIRACASCSITSRSSRRRHLGGSRCAARRRVSRRRRRREGQRGRLDEHGARCSSACRISRSSSGTSRTCRGCCAAGGAGTICGIANVYPAIVTRAAVAVPSPRRTRSAWRQFIEVAVRVSVPAGVQGDHRGAHRRSRLASRCVRRWLDLRRQRARVDADCAMPVAAPASTSVERNRHAPAASQLIGAALPQIVRPTSGSRTRRNVMTRFHATETTRQRQRRRLLQAGAGAAALGITAGRRQLRRARARRIRLEALQGREDRGVPGEEPARRPAHQVSQGIRGSDRHRGRLGDDSRAAAAAEGRHRIQLGQPELRRDRDVVSRAEAPVRQEQLAERPAADDRRQVARSIPISTSPISRRAASITRRSRTAASTACR